MSADVAGLLAVADDLAREGRLDEALETRLAAADLAPLDASIRNSVGELQFKLNRMEEALASFRLASVLNPRQAAPLNNMGAVFQKLDRYGLAVDAFSRAARLSPSTVAPHRNLGSVLQALGRFEEALASYERALAADPDDASSHADLALCYLRLGRLSEGWREYEWRWKVEAPKAFTVPLWLGQTPLTGKTILLHAEQGLGDTLQFCRYVPRVAGLGARIVVGAPASLHPLLRGFEGVAAVAEELADLPPFDLHCPLMSLALAFDTKLDAIPWSGPYIHADEASRRAWAVKLGGARSGEARRPRIGLTWSGSPLHKNDANRSIGLSALMTALPDGVDYHVLQNRISDADRAVLDGAPHVRFHGDDLISFADTAALCDALDGVVSVDTSLAHLAGAMGKPLWVLLPQPADWRWMVDRSDSPWYPSATLVRQPVRGDWTSALAALSQALTTFCGRLPTARD